MVNKVILVGNLGKDPEMRTLENGAKVAKFSIATNENYRDKSGEWQQQTEWHDIVAWRVLADRAEASLQKGAAVYLEGKLSTRTWQDQNGNNRRTTEVVANYFRVISRAPGSSGSSEGEDSYFSDSDDEPTGVVNDASNDSAGGKDGADDLPF